VITGAWIERDPENIGGGAFLAHRSIAGGRRDRGDARQAEVRPEDSGADHPVMRHDDQSVDLLVAVVGERKHRPIGVAFTGAHFDAANDSIRTRRGRDLDAITFSFLDFSGGGQIDSGRIETHVDRHPPHARRKLQRAKQQMLSLALSSNASWPGQIPLPGLPLLFRSRRLARSGNLQTIAPC
jgi:hypothetical protein